MTDDSSQQVKTISWIFLATTGIAMLLLNMCTFNYSDDYPYAFCLLDNGIIDISRRLTGLSEILHSQYNHYFYANGRVMANGLVQLFMSFDNRTVFSVCNTLVFVGYITLLQTISDRRHWFYGLLTVVLLFALLRSFGDTLLWMSGALNHLWGGAINLLFLYLLQRHIDERHPARALILLAPLAFLAGWWQESFSVCIATTLCIFYVYNWRKGHRWSVTPTLMTVCYITGALLLVCSPGTFLRMERDAVGSGISLRHAGTNICYVLLGLRFFWVAVIIALIRQLRHSTPLSDFMRANRFLLTVIAIGIAFLFLLGRAADRRAFFAVETLSLIIVLRQLPLGSSLRLLPGQRKLVALLLVTVAILAYAPILNISWKNRKVMQQFESAVSTTGETVFFDIPHYSHAERHYLGSRLEFNHHSVFFPVEAAYYSKRIIRVLPTFLHKELYQTASFICQQNEERPGEYSTPGLPFYVVPLPAGAPLPHSTEEVEYVSFPSGKYALKERAGIHRKRMTKRRQRDEETH